MTSYDKAIIKEKDTLSTHGFLEKLLQVEAGYTENSKDEYKCRSCVRWIKETNNWGRCSIVEGPIRATATCNYYQFGTPMEDEEGNKIIENEMKLGQDIAGYVEPDVTCGRCVYFNAEKEACRIVSGTIKAGGCCNLWRGIDTKE